jgi:hypothetical protein
MDGEVLIVQSMEEEGKDKLVNKDVIEKKHIFLKIWVVACIIASFIASVVLATIITTYFQYTFASEKDYCYQL